LPLNPHCDATREPEPAAIISNEPDCYHFRMLDPRLPLRCRSRVACRLCSRLSRQCGVDVGFPVRQRLERDREFSVDMVGSNLLENQRQHSLALVAGHLGPIIDDGLDTLPRDNQRGSRWSGLRAVALDEQVGRLLLGFSREASMRRKAADAVDAVLGSRG
jgi:hypothetical protein